MSDQGRDIRMLGSGEVPHVVDVLCESFFDYPVMRFVLGRPDDYDRRLRTLVRFFVMARVLRRELLLGIGDPTALQGVALVSRPHGPDSPPALQDLREEVWRELGGASRSRYEAFGEACDPFQVDVPHLHLNMIGVRRSAQGRGVGGKLIRYVHEMSREDPGSSGVTLTTEDEANVALYEHLGYDVIGHAVVSPGVQSWGFFRPDDAGPGGERPRA